MAVDRDGRLGRAINLSAPRKTRRRRFHTFRERFQVHTHTRAYNVTMLYSHHRDSWRAHVEILPQVMRSKLWLCNDERAADERFAAPQNIYRVLLLYRVYGRTRVRSTDRSNARRRLYIIYRVVVVAVGLYYTGKDIVCSIVGTKRAIKQ